MTTNDRFAADLRRHLLATADERPAEGQLAAVAAAVEATSQRRPLVARLTWTPGRIGPVPVRTLRYGLLAAALVGATVGTMLLAGGGSSSRTLFEGTWRSTDPADQSTQTLVVGAGAEPAVRFEDDFATGAACVNDAVKHFTADGTGIVDGFQLDVRYPNGGGCGLATTPMAQVYDYDGATDTLSDESHLTWTRVALGGDAETRRPSIASPAAPTGDPACLELAAGGSYAASFDGVSLTATVPATGTWHGLRQHFSLLRGPCLGGGPTVQAALLTQVSGDPCHWHASGTDVSSAEAAAAKLSPDAPTVVTIAGVPAHLVKLVVPATFDTSTCDEGAVRFWRTMDGLVTRTDPGSKVTVYLLDWRGAIVVIAVTDTASAEIDTPSLRDELGTIIESFHIE